MPCFRALACLGLLTAELFSQYAGEPPLVTTPPTQTATFGAAAFGGSVTQVAQLNLMPMRNARGAIVPGEWYVTATVVSSASPFFQMWSGTYVPGRSPEIQANADVAALNNPTVDMFACNVSPDLLCVTYDTGAATPPAIARRPNPIGPFSNPVPVGGPVPAGYRDSQIFDRVGPNQYEYAYGDARRILKVVIDVTTGAAVGTPTILVEPPGGGVHSPAALRQWTGDPADHGTTRAMIFSKNSASADCHFRSSVADNSVQSTPLFAIYSNSNWKANPTHIGGSTYWAHAIATYIDPLQVALCAGSSARVSSAGGNATICVWVPRDRSPKVAFAMFGVLGAAGQPISGMAGLFALNRAPLVLLPLQPVDPTFSEASWNCPIPPTTPMRVAGQVGYLDLGRNTATLGGSIEIQSY